MRAIGAPAKPDAPGSAINSRRATMGRALLLWLLGVPIPIIILLALIWH
jgi:hypothetical protein